MGLKEVAEQLIAARAEEKGFKIGLEIAKEEKNVLFVTNLIRAIDFSDERIAALVDVPVVSVQKMRNRLAV